MQLSQKEASLLKDMKDQEKLCIEKYSKHAACACDGQLKNLFTQLASAEKQHLGYLDKIGEGTVPQVATGSSSIPSSFSPCYGMADTPQKQSDCFLCSDLLAGEKHVSSLSEIEQRVKEIFYSGNEIKKLNCCKNESKESDYIIVVQIF